MIARIPSNRHGGADGGRLAVPQRVRLSRLPCGGRQHRGDRWRTLTPWQRVQTDCKPDVTDVWGRRGRCGRGGLLPLLPPGLGRLPLLAGRPARHQDRVPLPRQHPPAQPSQSVATLHCHWPTHLKMQKFLLPSTSFSTPFFALNIGNLHAQIRFSVTDSESPM